MKIGIGIGIDRTQQLSSGSIPVVVSGVNIAGPPVVNQTLTVSYTITGTPTVITRRWYRGATLISTSTSSDTYVLTQADAGNTSNITCNVDADGVSNATSNTIAQILTVRTAAFATSTGIVNTTYIAALNNADITIKSTVLDSKLIIFRPYMGGTADTVKYNFMNALNTDSAFRMVQSGSWDYNADGAKPNGVNGYANSKFNPVVQGASLSNFCLAFYQLEASTSGESRCKIGVDNGVAAIDMVGLANYNAGLQEMGMIGGAGVAQYAPNAVNPPANGFTAVSTNGSRSAQHYKHGGVANGAPVTQTGNFPNFEIFEGAINRGGIPATYFSKRIGASIVSLGLSAAEIVILFNMIQTLRTEAGLTIVP